MYGEHAICTCILVLISRASTVEVFGILRVTYAFGVDSQVNDPYMPTWYLPVPVDGGGIPIRYTNLKLHYIGTFRNWFMKLVAIHLQTCCHPMDWGLSRR